MKKIISGKVYDTDTARFLGGDGGGDGFYAWSEALYQKRTGEYFLYGEGGPATKYAYSVGQNQWSGGSKIIPLDLPAARKWAEDHMDADDYEQIFGLPDEDAEPVSLYVKALPAPLMASLRQRVSEEGTTLAAVVENALRSYLTTPVPKATATRRWFLVDDCMTKGAFCEEEDLKVATQAEAVAKARRMWSQLTKRDQDDRDQYYVCLAGTDDDGCIIYETATNIVEIKPR